MFFLFIPIGNQHARIVQQQLFIGINTLLGASQATFENWQEYEMDATILFLFCCLDITIMYDRRK
jgi:hypothetical protein